MKKTAIYLVAILTAATTIFTSCKKDEVEPQKPSAEKKCLVTTVKVDGKTTTTYKYNTNRQLNEINLHDASGEIHTKFIGVYENGRPVKFLHTQPNGQNSYYMLLDYNADMQLSRVTHYTKNFSTGEWEPMYIDDFDYNPNKTLSRKKQITISNGQEKIMSYEDFVFNEKGNISKSYLYMRTFTDDLQLYVTSDYQFDDKKNPAYNANALFIFGPVATLSPNNITSKTETYENSSEQGTINYLYTYNDDNYPVKMLEAGKTTEYEYNCQ